ncbi:MULTISPECIES: hypothetical protein [Halocynthiibacter]|uniref:DUF2946 domain-containing protein n=1 Tax=Halocynthiibacter halioticoli TaxID=2986804 RepID=A0AAE3J1V0_9RHOB|nr:MULTISPECIES: hypothetical protein [Halocynthiibacter]MCV6825215.1 hypothetical protein [Halocynthiibacter halioticoli]MCW4058216.1 hypothetical protein [Halocynthiibacter sp. SDUM655004]
MSKLLAFALVALIGLTNVAMAVGQMRADASGEMVLCVGNGHITVQVDADGQPIQQKTVCPECMATVAFGAPQQTHATPSSIVYSDAIFQSEGEIRRAVHSAVAPPSRAPPAAA